MEGQSVQFAGQPIFILKEGSQRSKGKDAQNGNIMAAKVVSTSVKTTLGPKGMDKMLVNSIGDIVITNDGATILKEMDIEHPAAKMIVEVAKTQDEEVGDGTTTAAVLAGELLKNAESLLEQNIHPTVIINGYNIASMEAKKKLQAMAKPVKINDKDLLLKIAATAIIGRISESLKDIFANIAVSAILKIVDIGNGKNIDIDNNIKIEKQIGGNLHESELVNGVVINKERSHTNMPKKVKDANILLFGGSLEIKKTETKAEISIDFPSQLQLFIDNEEQILRDMANKIIDIGANVVFVQQGIEEEVQSYLAKNAIYAVSRVDKKDMDRLARATGAKVVSTLKNMDKSDIGNACIVEEKKVGENSMTYVEECINPRAISIIIRGGEKHVVEEAERLLHDALRVVGVAIEDETIVAGGGSPEVELALMLREFSGTLSGREQLAVNKFADALEVIPRSLAENAGFDPIDKLVDMRSQHEKGVVSAGLNAFTGQVVDMWKEGVVEPCRVKIQSINSATEAANMILSIDDNIYASKKPIGGVPPGSPEMY